MGRQRALPASAVSRVTSAQNNQYDKVAYFDVACSEPLYWFRPKRNLFSGFQNLHTARESDLKVPTRKRQASCYWHWVQTLQLTLLTLSMRYKVTDLCLPSSLWKPHISFVPSPECTLHAVALHTPLSSELMSLYLHLSSGVLIMCLLYSFEGDWEGGVRASPLRMHRHIWGEVLLNLEGFPEGSGRPQIMTNVHYPVILPA